jgi:hypothetical protein
MQQELLYENPDTSIRILGINAIGEESGNPTITEGRVLPWLQDTVIEDVWLDWQVTWRDVVILDRNNVPVDVYNLTVHDLNNPLNYVELKQLLKIISGDICNSFGDTDGDGVCNDGNNSGVAGDKPCTKGETLFCDDNCPNTPNGSDNGTCITGAYIGTHCNDNSTCGVGGLCSMNQEDTDNDTAGDACDNCIDTANPSQIDCDNDTFGDACDPEGITDTDGDLIDDGCDNCPNAYNPGQEDTGGDPGMGDACDDICTANLNGDSKVNSGDLLIMKIEYNKSGCVPDDPLHCCKADISRDGKVKSSDLLLMKLNYNRQDCNGLNPPCIF